MTFHREPHSQEQPCHIDHGRQEWVLPKLHGDGKGKKAPSAQPNTPREGPCVLVQTLGQAFPGGSAMAMQPTGRLSLLGTSRGNLNKLWLWTANHIGGQIIYDVQLKTDVAYLEVFMGMWKYIYPQCLVCSEHSINTCGMNDNEELMWALV